jgi:hypothetical protein
MINYPEIFKEKINILNHQNTVSKNRKMSKKEEKNLDIDIRNLPSNENELIFNSDQARLKRL